jgi:hypothetical protein
MIALAMVTYGMLIFGATALAAFAEGCQEVDRSAAAVVAVGAVGGALAGAAGIWVLLPVRAGF